MMQTTLLDNIERGRGAPVELTRRGKSRDRKKSKVETAGSRWFDLPATPITTEVKLDLKMLQMRGHIDKKQHFKKSSSQKELPKYFHIGKVVENAADFYSSRLTKKEQKPHFVDELLADQERKKYLKRKFLEVQQATQSGGMRHYKKQRAKRSKKK